MYGNSSSKKIFTLNPIRMWQLFCIPLVSCFVVFCQLVLDPLYGDFSCMQVGARNLKTNVVDMYASCTFSSCVLHWSSCKLMLTVMTDVLFIAFECWAASWIMFSAHPAYMQVTCPVWCYCDLLRCLCKYRIKLCGPHLDFSHVMFWLLLMNAGYYVIFDLKIFHLHFTVLFCGTETWEAQRSTQYSLSNAGVHVMQSLELVLYSAACTFTLPCV